MTRPLIAFALVLTLLLGGAWAVQAQDASDGAQVSIMTAPTVITIPEEEPLVLWVRSVEGKTARVVVLVETKNGYQQLTPCDNVAVICEDALIPAEGTQQGDTFFLGSE